MTHDPSFGKPGRTAYRKGCRCEGCRAAKREARVRKKPRAVSFADLRPNERLAALQKAAEPRKVHIHGIGEVDI